MREQGEAGEKRLQRTSEAGSPSPLGPSHLDLGQSSWQALSPSPIPPGGHPGDLWSLQLGCSWDPECRLPMTLVCPRGSPALLIGQSQILPAASEGWRQARQADAHFPGVGWLAPASEHIQTIGMARWLGS